MTTEKQKINEIKTLPDDSVFYFLYKKIERISLAVYLVSDFFDLRESLRWDLRSTVNNILENVFDLYEGKISKNNIYSDIIKLESLFTLAYQSRLVSDMNYEIIKEEIGRFRNEVMIVITTHSRDKQTMITNTFFNVEIPENTKQSFDKKTDNSHKGHSPIKNVFYKKDSIKKEVKVNGAIKKNDKSLNLISQPKKSGRKEQILELIKKNQPVSIKDISHSFEGVSEKTIQRDLTQLIDQGVLKREGERRWSTYSLLS